jgi:spore germination protein GerM
VRRRPAIVASALILAASAASACGVPDDREPRVIAADDAPLDLDPTDDRGPESGPAEVRLYFVGHEEDPGLVVVSDNVDDPTLDVAIDALLARSLQQPIAGPEGEELASVIPPETVRNGSSINDEIATIDFGCNPQTSEQCGITAFDGNNQLLLFGQLACTADSVRGVAGVVFTHEGSPQAAPLPNGESTNQPVRCFDYTDLLR